VDLFFVLSGFLIGGILLDARESPRYFKTFYIRRAYRIFPLYAAVTFLFLFRHLPFHFLLGSLGNASPQVIPWAAYVTLTQNFWMVHFGYGEMAMAVTWSLAVEEQFYLTIPFLIRKIKPSRLLYVLLGVVVWAPALRALIRLTLHNGDFACYVLMPCRADALCLGVLAAMLVRNQRGWNRLLTKRTLLYATTAALFVGVAFMTYAGYGQFSLPMTTLGYSWLVLFYTCCLLIAVSEAAAAVQKVLRSRWLMGLGTLAYCTYLIHVPVIQAGRRFLRFWAPPSVVDLPGALLGVGLTLLIATLSWRYFEKPLLRRGHMYNF
jgi:peptidoglycan/LPS O-acetylase OafA/YrhL